MSTSVQYQVSTILERAEQEDALLYGPSTFCRMYQRALSAVSCNRIDSVQRLLFQISRGLWVCAEVEDMYA